MLKYFLMHSRWHGAGVSWLAIALAGGLGACAPVPIAQAPAANVATVAVTPSTVLLSTPATIRVDGLLHTIKPGGTDQPVRNA